MKSFGDGRAGPCRLGTFAYTFAGFEIYGRRIKGHASDWEVVADGCSLTCKTRGRAIARDRVYCIPPMIKTGNVGNVWIRKNTELDEGQGGRGSP